MAKYRYEDELDDYDLRPSGRERARDRYEEDDYRTRGRSSYDRYEEDDYRTRGRSRDRYEEDDYRARGRSSYNRYEDDGRRPRKNGGRRRKKHPFLRFLLTLLIILALLFGAFCFLAYRYYGLSNFVRDDSTKSALSDLPRNNGMYNILLIGVDRRDTSWYGNSDSMILLSVNTKKNKIFMISFMRDLYAEIPGHGGGKLNSACAIGGPSLLVQTIEENFRVNIDSYAAVDFTSMIRIVDRLGGVPLELTDEEAEVANGYILDMANTNGEDASPHFFAGGGSYNADGYQAVSYSRIRYVGNSDYQRTERQRAVLAAMMSKMKHMNPLELNSFVQDVMPYITHNIDNGDMLSLLPRLPLALLYPTEQDRVPYDGLYTVEGEDLVADTEATRARLQETLY